VTVRGKTVDGITDRVGFLFQRDALLPWKTVRDNVLLPLQLRGVRGAQARERADAWIGRVGLRGFEALYPHQLSGGMRKRVALAQTLVYDPEILLMDEPFSALDVQTRNLMEGELLALWQGSGKTVIFVTHDLEEAIALADIHDVRLMPEFTRLYSAMWEDLRSEVLESYARARTTG